MRRQMQRDAESPVGVKAASEQHHGLAGLRERQTARGHAVVAGELDARHRRKLRGGQQAAVAFGHVVENALAHRRRHAGVPTGLLHGGAHVGLRQVDADHRRPGAHGGHHRRGVQRPRPAVVVPVQPGADDRFRRVARAVETPSGIRHFQGDGGQLAALGQGGHDPGLHRVMIGVIVLLAQHAQRGVRAVTHQLLRGDELLTALQNASDQRRMGFHRLGIARQRRQGGLRRQTPEPERPASGQAEGEVQTPAGGIWR